MGKGIERMLRGSVWSLLTVLIVSGQVYADTFHLRGGGSIDGKWLNPDREPGGAYDIRTEVGLLRLAAAQVTRVTVTTAERARYEALLPKMPDTVAGHWKMAEWCREQGLGAEREFHLEGVLRHEPDHADARRILGYVKVDGEWTTQDAQMEARGYVRYRGRWTLPQEMEADKRAEEAEQQVKDWRRKIKIWSSQLGGRRGDTAYDNIMAINDPMAADGLADLLFATGDSALQVALIGKLAKMQTGVSAGALIDGALQMESEELRVRCLDGLEAYGAERAAMEFVRQLKNPDNVMVRRAAVGLGRLPNPNAIRPLIEALITTHRVQISSGNPGQTNVGFGSGQGISGNSFSAGGGPKHRDIDVQNREVLDALIKMTGQNYQFDEVAWLDWWAVRSMPAYVDLRHGE
ncbi:MAG: hypothetical protein R3E01_18040 [Pirellulaceae bacterium]|nr:hypothetical protein [Planctomycetales bacterium]